MLATMHIIYDFESSFDGQKSRRYILASLESYCTTVNSVRDSVKIQFSIIHNGVKIADKESIFSGESIVLEDGFGGACGS